MTHPASITAALCDYVVAARTTPLPDEARAAAIRAVCNWLACALGAVADESMQAVRAVAAATGGPGQASLIGRAERTDVINAALVNGVAANALDYDDMHVATLIHPTGAVVAAALALGEQRHASGEALLRAVTAGIEIECRLGAALFPAHYDAGWHSTATMGTLGATAAAACVMGLSAERMAHAFGIGATQASGLRAMLPNPCKSYNVGHAAANGVRAALLAEAGLASAPDVLEATHGLFQVFGAPRDAEALLAELGTRHAVTEASLKPYPCGVVIHPLIDAAIEVAVEHDLDATRIRSVQAAVHPRAIQLAGRQHPADAIGGRFSLHHAAALALTRRAAGLVEFDDADVHAPDLVALRERMAIVPDPVLTPSEARIRIETLDDGSYDRTVRVPSGSPGRPLTDAQLEAKFIALARRALPDERARALYAVCRALDRLEDVAALSRFWHG